MLFLKIWNYRKGKWEIYTQDLTKEESLFHLYPCLLLSSCQMQYLINSFFESNALNKKSTNDKKQSAIPNDTLNDKTSLPEPFYNSSGKKVMEYISTSEIILDLPFVSTINKRFIHKYALHQSRKQSIW